ncbi:MAG: hypothetical protein MJ162_06425 [Treponema sp.]|nr:hypothetical protein [Treponema sp.]
MKKSTKLIGAALVALSFLSVSCINDTKDESGTHSKPENPSKPTEIVDPSDPVDPIEPSEPAVVYTLTVENDEFDFATVTITGEGNEKSVSLEMDDGAEFAALFLNGVDVTNDLTVDADNNREYNVTLTKDSKLTVYRLITNAQNKNDIWTEKDGTIYLCNAYLSGTRGISADGTKYTNAFIGFDAENIYVSNISMKGDETPGGARKSFVYNGFEQTGTTPIKSFYIENWKLDATYITNNFISAYTYADNAVITVKNASFANMSSSEIIRVSNRTNANNVTLNFENLDWAYDETHASYDVDYSSILMYQPWESASKRTLEIREAELTAFNSWTMNFKNCSYKGEKVTANEYPSAKALAFIYDMDTTVKQNCQVPACTVNIQ